MEKHVEDLSGSEHAAEPSLSRGQGMLPAAPPVLQHLDFRPYVRVVQGQGFYTSPAEEKEFVPFQATAAELRCLAQHHLERAYYFKTYCKATGDVGMREVYEQCYNFARYDQILALLPPADQDRLVEAKAAMEQHMTDVCREQEEGGKKEDRDDGSPRICS